MNPGLVACHGVPGCVANTLSASKLSWLEGERMSTARTITSRTSPVSSRAARNKACNPDAHEPLTIGTGCSAHGVPARSERASKALTQLAESFDYAPPLNEATT